MNYFRNPNRHFKRVITLFIVTLKMNISIIFVPQKGAFPTNRTFRITFMTAMNRRFFRKLTITMFALIFLKTILVLAIFIDIMRKTARADNFNISFKSNVWNIYSW